MYQERWVAGYHSTMAVTATGLYVWGDAMAANGSTDLLNPTALTPANSYNYTGTPVLFTQGDGDEGDDPQSFLLTTTGLWVWGYEDAVIPTAATAATTFQATTLPGGVLPSDVREMTACWGVLALVTNTGNVFVRGSGAAALLGDGSATNNGAWHQAAISNVRYLEAVTGGFFVITTAGTWYTWGPVTSLGDGTGPTSRSVPTVMTAAFAGAPAMIALTNNTAGVSYYAVNPTDRKVYVLGENANGRLGTGNTTDRTTWTTVRNPTNTGDLANVTFVSATDNSPYHNGVCAITTDSMVYFWGENDDDMLSTAAAASQTLPVVPAGFTAGVDKAVYAHMSGHYSLVHKKGLQQPCFVGHRSEGNVGDGVSGDAFIGSLLCTAIPDLDFCISLLPPLIHNDSYTVYNNGSAQRLPSILANDSDPNDVTGIDNNGLSIPSFSATSAAGGTVTYNGDGTFNYTAPANFSGSDQFTAAVMGMDGLPRTSTVFLSVWAKPDAVDDVTTTNEDTPVAVNARGNDSDSDGGALTITHINGIAVTDGGAAVAVPNGTAALLGGQIVFTPAADFNGATSFPYTLTDADPPVNTPWNQVQATALTYNTWSSATAGSVAGNAFTITGSTAGTLINFANQLPAPHTATVRMMEIARNWAGSRTITFSTPIDGTYRFMMEDVDYTDNVSLSFLDAGGTTIDPHDFRIEFWANGVPITTGSNLVRSASKLTINGPGSNQIEPVFVITPSSPVKSIVINSTGAGTSGTGYDLSFARAVTTLHTAATDVATVNVTVMSVNDPPRVFLGSTLVTNGSFESGAAGWTNNSGVEVNPVGSYGVPAAPNGTNVSEVECSTLAPTSTASYLQQTVNTVAGQQYLFSVQAVNRVNLNTLDRGILNVAGTNVLSFTTGNTWSTYSVTFTATAATTTIRIVSNGATTGSVQPGDGGGLIVDDVRVVQVDHYTTFTENAAAVTLASTMSAVVDTDNANMVSATITLTNPQTGDRLLVNGSAAASGTLGSGIGWTRTDTQVSLSGSFTKAQYAAALRTIQFHNTSEDPNNVVVRDVTVVVNDGGANSNTAHAYIDVIAVNDAPLAEDDAETTPRNTPITGGMMRLNDGDVDDGTDEMAWSLLSGGTAASNGTLAINANGTFTYTPGTNFIGTVSFTYRVCDPGTLCDDATVTIDVYSLLPVELLSFTGNNAGLVNQLFWSTATERACDRFEVERSADGISFTMVGSLPGAGYSVEQQDYAYDDLAPMVGMNYYRLRQVDTNDAFVYTPVIGLHMAGTSTGNAHITLDPEGLFLLGAAWSPRAKAELINSAGQIMPGHIDMMDGRCLADLRGSAAAVYIARVYDAGTTHTYKLVRP